MAGSVTILLLTNLGQRDLGEDTPKTGSAGVGTTLQVSKATADLLVSQRKARILSPAEAKTNEAAKAAKAAGKPVPEVVKTPEQTAAELENSRIATGDVPSADAPTVKAALAKAAEDEADAAEEAAEADVKAAAKAKAHK